MSDIRVQASFSDWLHQAVCLNLAIKALHMHQVIAKLLLKKKDCCNDDHWMDKGSKFEANDSNVFFLLTVYPYFHVIFIAYDRTEPLQLSFLVQIKAGFNQVHSEARSLKNYD